MNLQNFNNIQSLLLKSSKNLRILFKNKWKQKSKKEWTNSENDGILFINGIGKSAYKKSLKIQKEKLKNGDTEFWDLSILLLIFRESDLYQESSFQYNIKKLTKIRNELAHHPTGNFDKTKFEYYWKEISDVLIFLGESFDDLEVLKYLNLKNINFTKNIEKAIKIKNEGNKYVKEENYYQAINIYSKAIAISDVPDTETAILYSNRAHCYFKQSLFEKALQDLNLAKTLNPNWFRPYFRIGKIYLEMGKFDEAIENFNESLSKDINNKEIKIEIEKAKKLKEENKDLLEKHIIEQGDICIEYGKITSRDAHATLGKIKNQYYYLNVQDKRITFKNGMPEDFIDIVSETEYGTYLRIHTLPYSPPFIFDKFKKDYKIIMAGKKVSQEIMFYFYKKYNINCNIFGNCSICDKEYLYGICILCDLSFCEDHKFNERVCKKCQYNIYDPSKPMTINYVTAADKIRECNYNTVYLLTLNVYENDFPTNKRVIKDYGFHNCKNIDEKFNLLGVYIGIIKKIECDLDNLDKACKNNHLIGFIINEYEKVRGEVKNYGEYYKWFLKNKHLVDNDKKPNINF